MKKLTVSILVICMTVVSVYAQPHQWLSAETKAAVRTYLESDVVPVLLEKQGEFDNTLSAEDLASLIEYRAAAQVLKQQHQVVFAAMRVAKQEGASFEDIQNQFGEELETMREERKALMEEVLPLLKANRSELRATMLSIRPYVDNWKEEVKDIVAADIPEEMIEVFEEKKERRHFLAHVLGGHKHFHHHGNKVERLRKMAMLFALWNGELPTLPTTTANVVPTEELNILASSYPNPVKEQVTIAFELPVATDVLTVQLVNQTGEIVKEKKLNELLAGSHEVSWSVNELRKGVYFYTIIADNYRTTQQLIVE